ncbi:anti-sigma factor [Robbsia sp. Bb-Pol-6]|uniref:Anti-sigma factor n=1 Tax=Robbsia betulipollinis TaxID=2981849 RepID=A0ABT3ZPH6_9BURK|nr:anti-sigma factor [Robbsia betulipollinis]MCY0388435.1 anti-sigma factor [Robbsia betulipollinis]
MIDDQANPDRSMGAPVLEAELHAFADRQLSGARHAQVEQFLASHPAERQRVAAWQRQNGLMAAWLDPVLEEPLPTRLPTSPIATVRSWRGIAAGLIIALASGSGAWIARGSVDNHSLQLASGGAPHQILAANTSDLEGFARRAAVAYVVYSPDARRPVEIGADQEQALVTWLTKRMGTAIHPPSLAGLGYELIGGRLLPGERGPVAQFMYQAADKARLTLYVTRDVSNKDVGFRFGNDGPVNVFYWIDDHFGYAISAGTDRSTLLKVSQEVYRQLKATRPVPAT